MASSLMQRTGRSLGIFSNDFAVRGLARLTNAAWIEGSPSWDEESMQRAASQLLEQLDTTDHLYVHMTVTTSAPVERQCAMDRLDQLLIKPLSQRLAQHSGRLAVILDDRASSTSAVIAMGEGIDPQPAVSLSVEALAESPLQFHDANALAEWFLPKGTASPISAA